MVPPGTPLACCSARVVGKFGVSGPQAFFIGNRPKRLKQAERALLEEAQPVELSGVVNGRLEKPGDIDCYRHASHAGEQVNS